MRAFVLHPASTVLTPRASGLPALLDALRRGLSIHAAQTGAAPIRTRKDRAPWLTCETSGSSGTAKVIRRRPESWQASFAVNARCFGLGNADRYATLGHLGHSLTLYALLEALHIGADPACLAGLLPRRQITALRDMAITVLYATPAQLHLLARGAEAAGVTALPAMRRLFCGGGRLDAALRARIAALVPDAEIREFLGASETSFITMSDADTPAGSVGRAYPGVTLRIDSDGAEGTGEIWVESPYLFDGYARGSAQDTRRDGPALSIGEMGYLDTDGFLFLRGRKSRMVTVADRNVFPEEIERVAGALPGVVACAVLALPDAARGHRLCCVVQGRVAEADLRRACRIALGPQAVPQEIVFVAELPLLPAGKPDLQALSRQLARTP